MRIIILIILLLGLSGCNSGFLAPRNGGGSYLNWNKITTTLHSNGDKTVVEESGNVVLNQPQNPKDGGRLEVVKSPDGTVTVRTQTGSTLNIDADLANIGSLNKVTFAGIGLIISGVVIGIFSRGRYLKASIILGAAGVGLIILAFLLPAYKFLFLIAMLICGALAICYLVYSSKTFSERDVALDETIDLIQNVKEEHLTPEQNASIFKDPNGLAQTKQSKKSQRLIRKKKEKLI